MTAPRPPSLDTSELGGLARRIAAGDHDAFADFYDTTSSRVYGMALRVLRDPGYAEETVQEVYMQAWRSSSAFDPTKGSALSWLITMAHRRAIDRVRVEQAARDRNDAYGAVAASAPIDEVAEEITRRDEHQAVADCLDTLTTVQRSSIDLAYYGGMTYRQVAEHFQVSLPTIKSRMRGGLARLRECLSGSSHD